MATLFFAKISSLNKKKGTADITLTDREKSGCATNTDCQNTGKFTCTRQHGGGVAGRNSGKD